MRQILQCIWDPGEFRSDYGLRSLSKHHEAHPYVFGERVVRYSPGESEEYIKGGNSNWRGPLWFPTTFLMIESLRKLRKAYGQEFTITSRTAAEGTVTLDEIARGFANRMISLFTRNTSGKRPIYGDMRLFQDDPRRWVQRSPSCNLATMWWRPSAALVLASTTALARTI
jgi:hypothetical protein